MPCDPAIQSHFWVPKQRKREQNIEEICTLMHTVALFMAAKKWKQLRICQHKKDVMYITQL